MVTATFYRQNEQITAFELSGHAGSGPIGYDLVCAAVSAVSFGAVNAIQELCNIELNIKLGDEGGYLYAVVPQNIRTDLMEKAQTLLEGMYISLKTIERDYSKFIKVKNI